MKDHIKLYIDKHNLELTPDELESLTRSVDLWLQYSIEEVIEDAVKGIKYTETV